MSSCPLVLLSSGPDLSSCSCWLRDDLAFYVGVVAYFLLIFTLCLLVFVLVLVQLSRVKRQNPQHQPPSRGLLTEVRSVSGLAVLLGLTWGFALFAWGPLALPFLYLFSIFNSLQGAAAVPVVQVGGAVGPAELSALSPPQGSCSSSSTAP